MRLVEDQVFPVRLDGRVIYKATCGGRVIPDDFPDAAAAEKGMVAAREAAWRANCEMARKDATVRKALILELLQDVYGQDLGEIVDAANARLAEIIEMDRVAG